MLVKHLNRLLSCSLICCQFSFMLALGNTCLNKPFGAPSRRESKNRNKWHFCMELRQRSAENRIEINYFPWQSLLIDCYSDFMDHENSFAPITLLPKSQDGLKCFHDHLNPNIEWTIIINRKFHIGINKNLFRCMISKKNIRTTANDRKCLFTELWGVSNESTD